MATSLLPQRTKIVQAVHPFTAGAAYAGDWVSLKGYDACTIIVHINHIPNATLAGNITVDKCTDAVTGANTVAGIQMRHVWANLDATTVDANQDTLVKNASAVLTLITPDAAQTDQIYVIEIPSASLLDNTAVVGQLYDCIRVNIPQMHVADYASAIYILHEARYQEEPMPAAVTN